MAFDLSKFKARFVEEARENLKRISDGLLSLERNFGDTETLNSIVRAAHTVKGSSRMLKLMAITESAHKLEDALDALRSGSLRNTKEAFDLMFKGVDLITSFVEALARGDDPQLEDTSLLDEIDRALKGGMSEAGPAPAVQASESPKPAEGAQDMTQKVKVQETIRIDAERLDTLIKLSGELLSHKNRMQDAASGIRHLEKRMRVYLETLSVLNANSDAQVKDFVGPASSMHEALRSLSSSLKDDIGMQDLLITEMQEKAMRMRMLPVSTVFDSYPRAIRDMAGSLNKEVELRIEGSDTELDLKIIEKLDAPLMHMIRNSVDHGIEDPQERERLGKPRSGIIKLSSNYEGGHVLIEISDDGRGIQTDMLRQKAIKKGIYDDATLDGMQESEIINLIFHHGLSTSAIITDISGRGVGMDVVNEKIVDELHGSVQIKTRHGEGTSFYIRLPLTLATMRLLILRCGNIKVSLPANFIDEIIRVESLDLIDVVDKKAIRLREQIIPVERLDAIIGMSSKQEQINEHLIVIIYLGNERLGLISDGLVDELDMVIKPLPPHMSGIDMVSGVAVTGANEIINVLHVPEVFSAARRLKAEGMKVHAVERKKKRILVADDSFNTREIEKEILKSYGYDVTLAVDGLDAYEKAMESQFDAIVTDIEMPKMDGFALTERLRAEAGYKHAPIIIVTSRDKEEDKRRGIRAGADAYIVKGAFDQTNLIDTVESLIGDEL